MDDEKFISLIEQYPAIYDRSLKIGRDNSKKEIAWNSVAETAEQSVDACKAKWKNLRDQYMRMVKRQRDADQGSQEPPKKWRLTDTMSFLNNHLRERRSYKLKEEDTSNPSLNDSALQNSATSNSDDIDTTVIMKPVTKPETQFTHFNGKDHRPTSLMNSTVDTPSPVPDRHRSLLNESIVQEETLTTNILQAAAMDSDSPSKGHGQLYELPSQLNDIDMFLLSLKPILQRLRPRLQTRARISLLTTLAELEELQRTGADLVEPLRK